MTELEIIYLAKECHNKQAYDILFNTHYDDIKDFLSRWFYKKHGYCYEDNEFASIAYFSITKALNIAKYKELREEFYFKHLCFKIAKFALIDYLRKHEYKNKKYISKCFSYDEFVLNSENKMSKDCVDIETINCEQKYIGNIFVETVIEQVKDFIKNEPLNHQEWIINKLISGGERLKQIDDISESERVTLWKKYKQVKELLKTKLKDICI